MKIKFLKILFILIPFFAFAKKTTDIPLSLYTKGLQLLENNENFDLKSIEAKNHVLMVLYNPLCDHCQTFIENIYANPGLFSQTKILFINARNIDLNEWAKNLQKKYSTIKAPNISFLTADETFFSKYIIKILPTVLLYNKGPKHKFIKQYSLDEVEKNIAIDDLKNYN